MHIMTKKHRKDVIKKAAQLLTTALDAEGREPLLFLASGGSAQEVLEQIDHRILGEHITLGVVDERYGVDKNDQNFYQLTQTAFAQAVRTAGGTLCDAGVAEARDVFHAGELLARCIYDFRLRYPDATIITLLGVGVDGHTAGIMPFNDDAEVFRSLFVDTEAYAVGYDAKDKNAFPLRATVTCAFLAQDVDYAVVYAVGADKKDALHRVVQEDGLLHETPARIFHAMKDVVLCTDQPIQEKTMTI